LDFRETLSASQKNEAFSKDFTSHFLQDPH
jgi:hypothetical protein